MFGLYNPETREFLPLPVSSKEELLSLLALLNRTAASTDPISNLLPN